MKNYSLNVLNFLFVNYSYIEATTHMVCFAMFEPLQERLVASKYSREGITVDMCSKGYMDVGKGPLSVASVKQKGRQWQIFQANVSAFAR